VLTGGVNTKSAQRAREAWQAAVARAPRAEYTNLPNTGHNVPFDAPDAVIDAIVGVLTAVQARQH
jgi:pimeloyl-ACP methyl ester carboxylesterase